MTYIAKKVCQVMGDEMLYQRAAAYILRGNGIHIWEAYSDCRKIGREPPPWVFAYFDESAARLLNDTPRTPARIADALDLRVGGRSPATRRRKDKEDLSFLWTVSALEKLGETKRDKIFVRLANDFGMDKDSLSNRYYKLLRKLR